jgi:GDPmannose 4,6-dehydratase
MHHGLEDVLYLGNLDAKRDWGHAKDYVEAMWLILQQKKADDFVIGTGEQHSVRQFVKWAFEHVDINIVWKGKGLKEVGINKKTGKTLVKIDGQYYRPAEVETLLGDASKAKKLLKWKPKNSTKNMLTEMMVHDLNEAEMEKHMINGGFKK